MFSCEALGNLKGMRMFLDPTTKSRENKST